MHRKIWTLGLTSPCSHARCGIQPRNRGDRRFVLLLCTVRCQYEVQQSHLAGIQSDRSSPLPDALSGVTVTFYRKNQFSLDPRDMYNVVHKKYTHSMQGNVEKTKAGKRQRPGGVQRRELDRYALTPTKRDATSIVWETKKKKNTNTNTRTQTTNQPAKKIQNIGCVWK